MTHDSFGYILKDGKKLRLGYTTGACAAAAAKAAALMLLSGKRVDSVCVTTPKGRVLELEIRDISFGRGCVSCAVEKDAGDDPDVTDGVLVFAEVSRSSASDVVIDGGVGVGRVTKAGLDQPVGAAAINSVPRRMIEAGADEARAACGYSGGLRVVISVPVGEALAQRTFNPRLGIVGGISILGSTGIVEPMSEQALIDTISAELSQRRAGGAQYALLTPGSYGADFIENNLPICADRAVMISNFVGDAVDICRERGFRGALLVGHIGKLVKIAGGMFNTHSKYGDCRMELIAAHAAACGLPRSAAAEILQCPTCDEALRIVDESGLLQPTLERLLAAVQEQLARRADGMETGVIVFSRKTGLLCQTGSVPALIEHIREEG